MSTGTAKEKISQFAGVPVGSRYVDPRGLSWLTAGPAYRKPRQNGLDHDWVYPCTIDPEDEFGDLEPVQVRDFRASTIYGNWDRKGRPDPQPSTATGAPPPPPTMEPEPTYQAPDTTVIDAIIALFRNRATVLRDLLEAEEELLLEAEAVRERQLLQAKEAHEKALKEHRARVEAARKAKEEQERKVREEVARKAKEEREKKEREEAAQKARQSQPKYSFYDKYLAEAEIAKKGDQSSNWMDTLGTWPRCTMQEARDAYYRKAKANHPDRNGSTREMVEINLAYERAQRYCGFKENFGSYPY